ncbi:MAG: flagellin, partial [Oscillospiraceae bacterium]
MVVRTNTMSANAYRQLGMNNGAVAKSLEKLSSGFRINRAGDDASGLAISEKMKAQIKGLEQASANSQDGISLVQTAEGALTEVHGMLNRMVELATKSANGTIQDKVDREAIQTEVNALNTEITRISKSTNFNGINLLDGSLSANSSKATVTDMG